MPDALRVAVLGAGTVGGAVVRAFLARPDGLVVDGGARLVLSGVAVRDASRAIRAGLPDELLTDAPAHLVASPDTDVVVELMGGDEPARTLVAAALEAGKPVVTANKHVIAHHGPALEAAARATSTPIRFEAAVGGGIPVLRPLAGDLAANCVERIRAIVNGTTNYILTAMARDGRGYADVLADAQAAGYAEADPTADVEGIDAANKLAILARLGFGTWLDPDAIVRSAPSVHGDAPAGITAVTDAEVAGVAALGLTLKLVADVSRSAEADAELATDGPGDLAASVVPTALPLEDPLARTSGVTNRIEVRAAPVGSVAFSGPGAGGPATASAVLGDLHAIARREGSTWAGRAGWPGATAPVRPTWDSSDRGWFFVLPGRTSPDTRPFGGAAVDTASIAEDTAVRVTGASLERVRGALRNVVGSERDVTLYPAEHRRPAP